MDDNRRKSNLIELRKRFIPLQYELQIAAVEYNYAQDQYRIIQDEVFAQRQEAAKEKIARIEEELDPIRTAINTLTIPYRISYSAEVIDGGVSVIEKYVKDISLNHYYPIDTTKEWPLTLDPNLFGLLQEINEYIQSSFSNYKIINIKYLGE